MVRADRRRIVEPMAAGSLFGSRADLLRSNRIFPAVWMPCLVAKYRWKIVSKGKRKNGKWLDAAPDAVHCISVHHWHRKHCGGRYSDFFRRAGRSFLDVGVCSVGHDDWVCGKDPDDPLSKTGGESVDRRAYVLHAGWSPPSMDGFFFRISLRVCHISGR